MRNEFDRILKLTRNGICGQINFEIDGNEYVRVFKPKERLIILGGGHIGKCLSLMASMVDFDIVVVDDRPEYASKERLPKAGAVICDEFTEAIKSLRIGNADYVVIATRAHRYDTDCVRAVLDGEMPYYAGLLGSRKRTAKMLSMLENEGYSPERLAQINTPIGLSIGALTVEEIAVSILAELIQYRRKNFKRKSGSHFLAEETFHENIAADIADNPRPQVLMLVYETEGSTPVKSGCFMTIDTEGKCTGTIGGGKGENIAITEGKKLIGSGQKKTIAVNMTKDQGSDEGLVCGGIMKIALFDL